MRTLRATAVAAACSLATLATAQGPGPQSPIAQPGFVAGGPAALAGAGHALNQSHVAGANAFVDAYGDPLVMPASYCGPGGCGGPMGGPMGGPGCGPMGGGYGGPGGPGGGYGGGWMNTEQCGPHYFDFSAEYLHYTRKDPGFSNSTVYSTNGFPTDDDVVLDPAGTFFSDAANLALRGGDVNSEDGNGFRLTGRFDVGALSVAEFTYSSVYWSDSAAANQAAGTRLFSIYSLYGTATNGNFDADGAYDDATFVGPEFEETANANRHTLEYDSNLQTAEATYRRYWVGYNPRVSGTVLVGFRYTSLDEALAFSSFNTASIPSGLDKSIRIESEADNVLAGVQVGGDAWVTLLQGFRVGAEGKVGLYNNDYSVRTNVLASDGDPSGSTTILSDDQAAFILEAKLMAVADLTPCWSLKAGYEVLFISDLALMGDSLASAQPYGDVNNIGAFSPTAIPGGVGPVSSATADGEVLFHGFTAGAEYVW